MSPPGCAFSHYIEADIFANGTSFSKVESRLDAMFARQGDCEEIVTDNCPPFCANEFENYLWERNIKLRNSTEI